MLIFLPGNIGSEKKRTYPDYPHPCPRPNRTWCSAPGRISICTPIASCFRGPSVSSPGNPRNHSGRRTRCRYRTFYHSARSRPVKRDLDSSGGRRSQAWASGWRCRVPRRRETMARGPARRGWLLGKARVWRNRGERRGRVAWVDEFPAICWIGSSSLL